jgi:chemotaxis protein MotB
VSARGGLAAARGRINEPADPLEYKDDDDTSWLIPYVDVISLLLAFLILTLSMSKISPRKFEMLTSTLAKQPEPPTLESLKESVDQMLRKEKLQNAVATSLDEEGLRVVFRGDGVLFESGQAEITPAGRKLIDQFIGLAGKTVDQQHQIAIEGHTDDVPIHTSRYDSNWELSSARATVVLKSFLAAGFDPRRLSAQGFADTRPARALPKGDEGAPEKADTAGARAAAAAAVAKARAENRRVVIRVYAGGTP